MSKVDKTQVFDLFNQIVVEELQTEPGRVVDEARLEADLGADDIAIGEIALEVEERFEIRLLDSEVDGLVTVSDWVEMILSKLP